MSKTRNTLIVVLLGLALTAASLVIPSSVLGDMGTVTCAGCGSSETTTTERGFPLAYYKTTHTQYFGAVDDTPADRTSKDFDIPAFLLDLIVWSGAVGVVFLLLVSTKKRGWL